MEPKKKRASMKPVSDTARGWAEGLARELEGWPGVTLKNSFGMTLVYRTGVVFGALPKTRALYVEDAILLKFLSEPPSLARRIAADSRFAAGTMATQRPRKNNDNAQGRFWRIFVMREDADVHAALEWFAEAYQRARRPRKQP